MKIARHPVLYLILFYVVMTMNDISYISVVDGYSWGVIIILAGYAILWKGFLNGHTQRELAAYVVVFMLLFLPKIHEALFDLNPAFRLRYILPSALLLVMIILVVISRQGKGHGKTRAFLGILSLGLLLSEILLAPPKLVQRQKINAFLKTFENPHDSPDFKSKSDIYHVVFDGYTGFDGLKQNWQFENAALQACIQDHMAVAAPGTLAAYENTLRSMASVFYQKDITPPVNLTGLAVNSSLYLYMIKNSPVIQSLNDNGYEIVNLSIFDLGNTRRLFNYPWFESDLSFGRLLLSKSTAGVIAKSVRGRKIHKYNKLVLDKLMSQTGHKGGRYVYAHFIMPHSPNNFNASGQLIGTEDTHESYIEELKYCDRIICEFLNLIEKLNEDAVVVIQSDHGSAKYDNTLEKRNILNIIRTRDDIKENWDEMELNTETYQRILAGLSR